MNTIAQAEAGLNSDRVPVWKYGNRHIIRTRYPAGVVLEETKRGKIVLDSHTGEVFKK